MSDTSQTFSSNKNLSIGSNGQEVINIQRSLNNRPPSNLPPLNPDGIFGKKTDARVREFQKNNGLAVDGVIGPHTQASLAGMQAGTYNAKCRCGNPLNLPICTPREVIDFFRNSRVSLGISSAGGSGPLQMLDDTQKAVAMTVYGMSLDFSTIFISRLRGFGGRPFTMIFKDSNQIVQIMNCGTFSPDRNTLIHELAHVWQSQHHSSKSRFMVNAVDSQAGAVVASTAAAFGDPMVSLNKRFPTYYPFDAYAYDPGLPIGSMAAEQMAKAIEDGVGGVVSHIKGVTMNAVDSACVTGLSRPGFADHRLTGVV